MKTKCVKDAGFTLVEILVIAPIVILVIGAFIGVTLSMTGEILTTRASDSLLYSVQDSLDRMSTDVRSSNNFLAANNVAISSPQGYDNGTAGFVNVGGSTGPELILDSTATTANPNLLTSQPVYLQNSPNACASSAVQQNATLHYNIVYFVSNNTLYRRIIANSNFLTAGCSTPWQRPNCAAGMSGAICKANDEILISNVSGITLQIDYYASANDTSPVAGAVSGSVDSRNTALQTANTIKVQLVASTTVAGRDFSRSATAKAVRQSTTTTSQNPDNLPGYNTVPSTPTVNTTYDPTAGVNFKWPAVSPAASYKIQYRLNSGSWVTATNSTTNTYYNMPMTTIYNGETIAVQVTASTQAGSSSAGTSTITTPLLNNIDFTNGWSNWNSSYHGGSYGKTASGLVVIEGVIRNIGSSSSVMGAIIGTLPPAYRPSEPVIYGVASSSGAFGEVRILSDGTLNFSTTPPSGWFSLNGIAYMPSGAPVSYTNLSITSPWSIYSSPPWALPAYTVDSTGRVYMKGLVGGAPNDTISTIATLPSNAMPQYDLYVPSIASDVWGDDVIAAAGPLKSLKGTNGWKSLQSIYLPSSYPTSSWTNMALQSSWLNYDTGTTYPPLRYTKTSDGMVMLQGFIKSGTLNAVVATLPAGYRPSGRQIFVITSWDSYGTADIDASGNIYITGSVNTGWVSLNNVFFMAEQ